MNLSECLSTADITTLRKIADYYDLSCSRHSKLALLQEILFSLRSRTFLDQHIGSWQAGLEYPVLRMCLDQRSSFSTEELSGMFQGCGGEAAIQLATQQGWLYPTTRLNGRLMYQIPNDLQGPLRLNIIHHFCNKIQTSPEGPLTYHEEGYALVRDVDVFLEYIRHHAVKLTREGSMYKRNLQQVLELLEVTEESLDGGWRFGYGRRFHDYPDRFALAYDYAYQRGLIQEADEASLVVTDACEDWYRLSELERQRDLVRFYISLYRRPIVRLPQIIPLIAYASSDWVNADQMLHALHELVAQYYYDEKEQVWHVRILKMLMHLGLIRVGEDENHETWFQITKLGQELLTPDAIPTGPYEKQQSQRILIVQPNFDIVVTGDQPLVTTELAVFTELKQAGVVRVYRLSEASVRKGMESRQSVAEWLDFVQRHAQTPVPGNVERTLLQWAQVGDNRQQNRAQ
jgi:hypothetical protein